MKTKGELNTMKDTGKFEKLDDEMLEQVSGGSTVPVVPDVAEIIGDISNTGIKDKSDKPGVVPNVMDILGR